MSSRSHSFNCACEKTAPPNRALYNVSPFREVHRRLAEEKSAPSINASVRAAQVRSARTSLAPDMSAPRKLAVPKSAFERSAPARTAFRKWALRALTNVSTAIPKSAPSPWNLISDARCNSAWRKPAPVARALLSTAPLRSLLPRSVPSILALSRLMPIHAVAVQVGARQERQRLAIRGPSAASGVQQAGGHRLAGIVAVGYPSRKVLEGRRRSGCRRGFDQFARQALFQPATSGFSRQGIGQTIAAQHELSGRRSPGDARRGRPPASGPDADGFLPLR